VDALS